jgi:NAD(P)H-dependent FMN reductase
VTKVSVIISSTREGRFGDQPANWFHSRLAKRPNVTAKLLDLRDFPMPFFDQMMPPAAPGRPAYSNEVVQRWTAEIAEADAFVIITAEYNFGPPAVLKNAIDWVSAEWNRKPVGFVSYGSSAGVRSVQQLREAVVELQMAPIRSAVHLPRETIMAYFTGGDVPAALANSDGDAEKMIDDLLWWAAALTPARRAAGLEA